MFLFLVSHAAFTQARPWLEPRTVEVVATWRRQILFCFFHRWGLNLSKVSQGSIGYEYQPLE